MTEAKPKRAEVQQEAQEEYDSIADAVGKLPDNISLGLRGLAEKLAEDGDDSLLEQVEGFDNLLQEFVSNARDYLEQVSDQTDLKKPRWF